MAAGRDALAQEETAHLPWDVSAEAGMPFFLVDESDFAVVRALKNSAEIDQYLRAYPHLHRWLNVCRACGARGYRPELPESIYPWFNVAAENLRRMFEPLGLDGRGLCDQCALAIDALAPRDESDEG